MDILINFKKAKNFLKNNDLDNSINYFVKMYEIKKKFFPENIQMIENIFVICIEPFLYSLSLEAKDSGIKIQKMNTLIYVVLSLYVTKILQKLLIFQM